MKPRVPIDVSKAQPGARVPQYGREPPVTPAARGAACFIAALRPARRRGLQRAVAAFSRAGSPLEKGRGARQSLRAPLV